MGPTTGAALVAVPRALAHWSVSQCGVVTRNQLAAAGFGRDHIRAAVAARRWQISGRRVVILHNAPLTPPQRHWVAVLSLKQPAALAGLTAAAAGGLKGFDEAQVHIVVSRSCSAELPVWVTVHNSRRFGMSDVHRGSLLPRTPIARSLVDAAAWSNSPRRACALLCAGVQQRLVKTSALTTALAEAGSIRHVRIMTSVLGDIGGGGHTLAELDLAPLAHQSGLPPPRRQVLRREADGRARYVDAEFDLPDGSRLIVEIDGAVHLKPVQWWDDMSRQNELTIGGGLVLRFDSVTVRLDEKRVIDQLARMRAAHLTLLPLRGVHVR